MVRMKQIWEVIPLPAKLKLVWSRLTSSRVITLYFVLSIVHCFIQVVFQLTAYSINFKATDFLSQLQITAGLNTKNFTLLSPDRKTLQSCWAIPGDKVERPCKILWAAGGMFEDGLSPDDFGVLKPKDRDILPLNPAPASSVVSVPTTTAVTSTRVPLSSITSSVTQSASIPVGSQIPGEEESDDDDDAASDTDSVDSDDDGFESDDSDDEGVTAGVTTSGIVPSSTIRPTSTVVVTRTVIGGSTATVRRVKRSSPSHSLAKRDVFITPITARTESDPNNFTITALQIIGLGEDPTATGDGHSLEGHQGDAVQVSAECVAVLSWPLQT
ncbi:hypothetical protein FRC03_004841 [Tulasnella sp. 419]|nr:hypothetical protein FRC03_004841 [Tulasnella sp. 419]